MIFIVGLSTDYNVLTDFTQCVSKTPNSVVQKFNKDLSENQLADIIRSIKKNIKGTERPGLYSIIGVSLFKAIPYILHANIPNTKIICFIKDHDKYWQSHYKKVEDLEFLDRKEKINKIKSFFDTDLYNLDKQPEISKFLGIDIFQEYKPLKHIVTVSDNINIDAISGHDYKKR